MDQPTDSRRASIIFNPVARGLSRHRNLLERSVATLRGQGIEARLVPTEAAGTAGRQARAEIDSGAQIIIAAGGDGTINEVAAGMLGTDVPLAILPGGTANVLAREMKIPIHMDRVAAQIGRYRPISVSAGRMKFEGAEPRIFLCMAGAGLDAEIVARVDPELKIKTGKFSYWVSGFGNLFEPLPEFDIAVDGRAYRASFALISRVRNYGGDMEIARNASLLRDDFEIVLFRGTVRLGYIPYLVGVAVRQVHRMSGCTVLHGRNIQCGGPANQRVYVQVDGELAGQLPAALDILPNAITMLLPPEYVQREQRFRTVAASA